MRGKYRQCEESIVNVRKVLSMRGKYRHILGNMSFLRGKAYKNVKCQRLSEIPETR